MKTIAFISLCIFGWMFSTPFKMVDSTMQKTVGGRAESGISYTYTLKMLAKADSKKLRFTDVWIDSLWFEARAYKIMPDHSFSYDFSKGDTLYIKVSYVETMNRNGRMLKSFYKPGKKAPAYEGKALLAYEIKGKKKWYELKEFRILPAVYMP